jgi:flagellar M-ring protein FliF
MIKDQVLGTARRGWDQFTSFTSGQKAVTVVAVLALLVGGLLFLTRKPATQYSPLYSNLAASDASAITSKLQGEAIPYKLSDGGAEVLVPTTDVDKARLSVSAAGLPNSGNTGYSLLDKEGVTTSQFQQQVDYQRAVEGELAKTIQSIDGVQAASVHLAIPQQDVFNDGSEQPTAAVLLTVAPATTLTDSQVRSVVYLVSSSVPGMKSDNVTVSDSNGNVLSAPGDGVTGVVGADTQAKLTQDYDNRLTTSLQNMLDRAVGAGHAVVTVNSQLDFSKTKTTKNSYLPDNGLSTSKSTSKETYNGTNAGAGGGTLGTSTDTTGNGPSGNGNYTKTDTVVNSALGTLSQTVENAPGQLQNMHIAVMLDKSVKGLNVAAISNLVRNGVGFNAARGDSLSVQSVPFDNSAAKQASAAAAAAAKAAAADKAHKHLVSLIKQAGLGLLLVAFAIGIWLASRKRRARPTPAPVDDENVLDLFDTAPAPPSDDMQTARLATVSDLEDAAARRRAAVVAAADSRPRDVANALSGWLTTKETAR